MCFSSEVSFGASVVISTMGIIAFKKAEKTPYRMLAVIPIIFGLQQFVEGFVWLGLGNESFSGMLQFSTYFFIIIAWIIWPIYIPITMWKIEKDLRRKKIQLAFVFFGLIVLISLIYLLISSGVNAKINDCSIQYIYGERESSNILFSILYLSTTIAPCLLSSVGKVWLLGVMNLITYLISRIYFNERVISVWCFFAAVSSVIILLIIMDIRKKERHDTLS